MYATSAATNLLRRRVLDLAVCLCLTNLSQQCGAGPAYCDSSTCLDASSGVDSGCPVRMSRSSGEPYISAMPNINLEVPCPTLEPVFLPTLTSQATIKAAAVVQATVVRWITYKTNLYTAAMAVKSASGITRLIVYRHL